MILGDADEVFHCITSCAVLAFYLVIITRGCFTLLIADEVCTLLSVVIVHVIKTSELVGTSQCNVVTCNMQSLMLNHFPQGPKSVYVCVWDLA